MNTTPADEILALWVEDELQGPELARVEAWAAAQPEWLAYREDARRVKNLLQPVLPAAEEPPYADFFNARIGREIAAGKQASRQAAPVRRISNWLVWFMPAAAAAGMVLCFWAGTHMSQHQGANEVTGKTENGPYLYTPENGVSAEWFASSDAKAAVIVLDGVAAIPDSFEIPDTAAVSGTVEATAGTSAENPGPGISQ